MNEKERNDSYLYLFLVPKLEIFLIGTQFLLLIDSSDSDDAETDEYNDDSGSGSKKAKPKAIKSVNGNHRGSSANGSLTN